MKITKSQLKQIIKEELKTTISEGFGSAARQDIKWQRQLADDPEKAVAQRREDEEEVRRKIEEMAILGIEIADPTGISGYSDVKGTYAEYYEDPTLSKAGGFLLSLLGALPGIGGKAGKARKAAELRDKVADTLKITRKKGKFGRATDIIEIENVPGIISNKEFLRTFNDVNAVALRGANRRDLKAIINSYEKNYMDFNQKINAVRNELKAIPDGFGGRDSLILATRAKFLLSATESRIIRKQMGKIADGLKKGRRKGDYRVHTISDRQVRGGDVSDVRLDPENYDLVVLTSSGDLSIFEMNKRLKAASKARRIPDDSALGRYAKYKMLKNQEDHARQAHATFAQQLKNID